MRVLLLLLALAGPSWAQEDEPSPSPMPSPVMPPPPPTVMPPPTVPPALAINEERTETWPFTLDLHVLVGVEPHSQGSPIAFGVGADALYHGWIGFFAALLASEGTPIIVMSGKPSLPDRVSVPLGLSLRPLGPAAANRDGWGWQLLGGLGIDLGVSVEHLRSTDDSKTTAGFHGGLTLDVPLYGGPLQGGVALRVAGRLIVEPEVALETNKSIREPMTSGQFFAGVAYTP